jgi:hypothetical protein
MTLIYYGELIFEITTDTSENTVTLIGPSEQIENPFLNIPSPIYSDDGIYYIVTSIGDNAFYDPNDFGFTFTFTQLFLPISVKTIGNYAFASCRLLASTNIPIGLTTIGNHAFYTCGLQSIIIPSSVTSIGEFAFNECSGLTSVTIDNPTTTAVHANSFTNRSTIPGSTITFVNITQLSELSPTWQTISTYYQNIIIQNTITVQPEFTKVYGDTPFNLGATSRNQAGPAITYSVSDLTSNIVSVDSSGKVTINNTGIVVIILNQAATSEYTAATATTTITINPSTLINPTKIQNGSELEYFLTTNAEYGNINNDVDVRDSLINSSIVKKILFTKSNNEVIIRHNLVG